MKGRGLIRSRLIDPFLRAQGSPRSIARGTALGLFLTLTPTVGVQMGLAAIVGLPWGANMPIAIALIWISNPVTIIPMYYSYYWLGTVILPGPARSYADVAREVGVRIHAVTEHTEGVWTALRTLGSDIGTPLIVGSLVMAVAISVPAYFATLHWAERRHARKLREHAAALAVEAAAAALTDVGELRPSPLHSAPKASPQ